MKTESTAMTTLKSVTLRVVSDKIQAQLCVSLQLAPWQGCTCWSVVGGVVNQLIRIAIPPEVAALLPKACAVQIWMRNTE